MPALNRSARKHLCAVDPVMAGLIEAAGPLRLQPDLACSPFRALARAIAHQQLNGTAANRIIERFTVACGGGDFPDAPAVLATSDAVLRRVGFSATKTAALKDLAARTLEGMVPDRTALQTLDSESIIERLTQVRGIGRWTVEMMLIFQLGRPDVLPVDDFGVRNGFRLAYRLRDLPRPRILAAYGERWAPWRSAATWYLWRAVDLARTQRLPPPARRVRLPSARRIRKVGVARAGK